MIESSPTIAELCKALHGAQGIVTGVVKDARNPHFKNRYATLEAVLDTVRPALQANGLIVSQAPGQMVDGCVEITTMLAHISGEWMRSTLHVPLAKRDPQGLGSAVTYGLRYALMAALCVPPTDDDGEAAMPGREIERPAPKADLRNVKDLHTNGKPIVRNTSQEISGQMLTALWGINGAKVERWLQLDAVKRDLAELDQIDRDRVLALADERRAIQ